MKGSEQIARFEQVVLPHLDAAYNLARWLMRQEQAAEDVVQESYLRAFEAFATFRGIDARAWVLTIVRNACFTALQRERRRGPVLSIDDEDAFEPASDTLDPQTLLMRRADIEIVRESIGNLPVNLREVIVLREIEGLSYQQIAGVIDVPIGTIMSRLSRARDRLQQILTPVMEGTRQGARGGATREL